MKKTQRATTAILLSASLISLVLCACNGRQSSLISLVPLDSCAVVVFDWSSVRTDGDLKRLFKGNDYETVLERLGVESALVKTVAVFSTINSQTAGLLLRGSLDKQKQLSTLTARGWREESVDGHKVYSNGSDYAAMPLNNTLFAGTRGAVVAVFRAWNDERESFLSSSSFRKMNAAMTGKGDTIRAFLVIPDGTLDMADAALEATSVALSLFDWGPIGTLLKQVNAARGFGLTLGRGSNEMYPVEMSVLMRDEKAAVVITDSLKVIKGLSEMASKSSRDRESLRALQSMTITRTQEVLAIKMIVPQAALFPPNPR